MVWSSSRNSGRRILAWKMKANCCQQIDGASTGSGLTFGKSPRLIFDGRTDLNSNGSYTQYCDLSRQYDPYPSPNTTNGQPDGTPVPAYDGPQIDPWTTFGKQDLRDYMNTYWINRDQENYVLWVHEYSKHATCFSTFDTPCYGPKHIPEEDVIEFFETVIKYDMRLPTWDWLAASDIVPSNTTTYTLSDLEDALSSEYGAVPYLGCSGPSYNETEAGAGSDDDGGTVLSEAWYYFNVKGRPQEGKWAPVDQTGSSSCTSAEGAISYPLRTEGSVRGS